MRLTASCPLLLTLAAACGDGVGGPGFDEPFVTLRGQIVSPATTDLPSEVHVALVWIEYRSSQELPPIYVAQELDVAAEFPASYELDITELPPEEAMVDGFGATGHLLVYDDTNGNGHLDMTTPGATGFEDHLLGYPSGLQVFYNESDGFFLEHWRLTDTDLEQTPVSVDDSIDISLAIDARNSCYLMDPQPGYEVFPEVPDHDAGPFGPLLLPVFPCAGNQPPAGAFTVCLGLQSDGKYHFHSSVNITPASQQIAGLCGALTSICSGTFNPANPPHFDSGCK